MNGPTESIKPVLKGCGGRYKGPAIFASGLNEWSDGVHEARFEGGMMGDTKVLQLASVHLCVPESDK